jgi:hypothetical protein
MNNNLICSLWRNPTKKEVKEREKTRKKREQSEGNVIELAITHNK